MCRFVYYVIVPCTLLLIIGVACNQMHRKSLNKPNYNDIFSVSPFDSDIYKHVLRKDESGPDFLEMVDTRIEFELDEKLKDYQGIITLYMINNTKSDITSAGFFFDS